MKPQRIQRKRSKGWKMPENTVYVGRPSKWGNDFIVVEKDGFFYVEFVGLKYRFDDNEKFKTKIKALECLLECYKECISCDHNIGKINIFTLRGKNLACWCREGEPCHADVLLKIANEK